MKERSHSNVKIVTIAVLVKEILTYILHQFMKERSHSNVSFATTLFLSKIYSPKCTANPIMVTPIWKWEFENKDHSIRSLDMTFFEKFLFKFPFSHERFQMGQKMYFYQLYKL